MAARFPHMLPRETAIWERYLAKYGIPEGDVIYDMHLGEGTIPLPHWPTWMKAVVAGLSRKRADVIVEARDSVTIYEVKRRAGMSAVGQLLGYEALYWAEKEPLVPVRLVCVCEGIEPDMEKVFDYYKISAVVV